MTKITQAVILAAGNSTRTLPLTEDKPKPLLCLCGKTLLEHNLSQLEGLVEEVILVIGYKGEMIKDLIGSKHGSLKIKYVWQKKALGTGDAAKKTLSLLEDKFLLLYGDDLYNKADIEKIIKKFPSILLQKVKNPSAFGQVKVNRGLAQELVEKPKKEVSNLVNTGFYFLNKSIFDFNINKSERGEYEFTDYISEFIKKEKLYHQTAQYWFPLPYPWDLLNVNEFLLKSAKENILGERENNCHIKGGVIIEKGSLIKSGTYIEGPVYIGKNCEIGPNCYLRKYSCIGDNCRIGQAVEIKNSIIGKGTKIGHLTYIGDSLIGENCNFGAGTIIANLRHDGEDVKVIVKEKLINTNRKKFGAILGNNVKTGIGTIIYPGRKIWSGQSTKPGEIIQKDITN